MTAYYNEFDPYAAQWLRNLIDAGHLPPGDVDTRSIEDVRPQDLLGYTQCHFFAGLGGWAHALDLAGWPRSRPVWTGSCPCQPFSAAGKGDGFADERHLWPSWQHLISQCNPPVVFGEQVASKAVDAWIDLVHADMEGMGYSFGSIPFPAAGVGAPHIRDRNYWVAYADRQRLDGKQVHVQPGAARFDHPEIAGGRGSRQLADATSIGRIRRRSGEACTESRAVERPDGLRDARGLADSAGERFGEKGHPDAEARSADVSPRLGATRIVANTERDGLRGEGSRSPEGTSCGVQGADGQREWVRSNAGSGGAALHVGMGDTERHGLRSGGRPDADIAHEPGDGSLHTTAAHRTGPTNGLWANADWLRCTDGKWRAVEPGTFPLAHGVSGRVGRLRAYGNAIVPQQAAHFIEAFCEACGIEVGLTAKAA